MCDDLKDIEVNKSVKILYYLKSKQDHHDQLPGLFPPGSEKTSVADASGNWGVFYSWGGGGGGVRYFWGVTHTGHS